MSEFNVELNEFSKKATIALISKEKYLLVIAPLCCVLCSALSKDNYHNVAFFLFTLPIECFVVTVLK